MSTADLLGTPGSVAAPDPRRRAHLRTAGLGALGAFAAWALVPVQVFAGGAPSDDPGLFYDTAGQIAAESWRGPYDLLAFGGVGIGLLVMVTALAGAVELQRAGGVFSAVGRGLGLLGAFGYILGGTVWVGFYAFGAGVGDVTGDESVQRVVHVTVEAVATGFLTAGALGLSGWLLWLGTIGRRAGIAGLPALVAAGAFTAALLVPLALWTQPMAAVSLQPLYCLVLGVALLVKARRGR